MLCLALLLGTVIAVNPGTVLFDSTVLFQPQIPLLTPPPCARAQYRCPHPFHVHVPVSCPYAVRCPGGRSPSRDSLVSLQSLHSLHSPCTFRQPHPVSVSVLTFAAVCFLLVARRDSPVSSISCFCCRFSHPKRSVLRRLFGSAPPHKLVVLIAVHSRSCPFLFALLVLFHLRPPASLVPVSLLPIHRRRLSRSLAHCSFPSSLFPQSLHLVSPSHLISVLSTKRRSPGSPIHLPIAIPAHRDRGPIAHPLV